MADGVFQMTWEKTAKDSFEAVLGKIPVFLRPMAMQKVSKKAEQIAQNQGREEVSEKDVVDAFFVETPFGFHGPMKMDMDALKIDYRKYGHS